MRKIVVLVIAVSTELFTNPVFAGELTASAVLTAKPDGSNYEYSITLTNTSSGLSPASIGTFWFGWTPGQDYLSANPTDITTPAGWMEKVTHAGANDGYAIQFVAESGTPLVAPGNSLSGFGFTSSETPTELAGDSSFYNHPPETTSFVYAGTPFTNPSDQFVVSVSSVPEPSSLVLGLIAVVTSSGYLRLNKGKKTARHIIK